MSGEDEKSQVETPQAEANNSESKSESQTDEKSNSVANGEGEAEEKTVKKGPKRKAAVSGKKNKEESADSAEVESEGSKEEEKITFKTKKAPLPKKSPSKKQSSPKKRKVDLEEKNDDEDHDENDDNETDGEEDEETEEPRKKGVPLLDQPLEIEGRRERKKVSRLEFTASAKDDKKPFEVPKGKGAKLRDIPRIEHFISKFSSENIKPVAKALFGSRVPGKTVLKKMIRDFNGFDFDKSSDQWEKRSAILSKLGVKQLKVICQVLDLERSGTVANLTERIMEFCVEPKDSGKKPPASKPKRKSGSEKPSKRSIADSDEAKSSRSSRGKGKRANLKDASDSDSVEAPKRSNRGRVKKAANYKDDSSEDEEKGSDGSKASEHEDDDAVDENNQSEVDDTEGKEKEEESDNESEGEKTKKVKEATEKESSAKSTKKTTLKKSPSKRKVSESEEESAASSDDEPLIKKTKASAPPTDEDIKTYVKKILEGANLEQTSMKTVCKQVYEHYPDHNLAHKKDLIKGTVKSLIAQ